MHITSSTFVRKLTVAQALYVFGNTVDLTLTGVVGASLAPNPALATVPYATIFLAAGAGSAFVPRALARVQPRIVFTAAAAAAAISGLVSATAVQLSWYWLFCVGTALIGVYTAGAGYYRYVAAEAMPQARARAVSQVLAAGIVAALIGPFLATSVRNLTGTPYVASYLLVAVLGGAAVLWNSRLPAQPDAAVTPTEAASRPPRSTRELWAQPRLRFGVLSAMVAMGTMAAMMTAGPIFGQGVGYAAEITALAVQLHMIGMYAPGLVVAKVMNHIGTARIAALGAVCIATAGVLALCGAGIGLLLAAMFLVGVGWNLSYTGGSALISAAYQPNERVRVQAVSEPSIIAAQVAGSLGASAFVTLPGWGVLGWCCLGLGMLVVAAYPLSVRASRT